MPLHEKNNLLDDVYASSELKKGLSKTKFPQEEQEAIGAYQLVHDEIMLDGNARQNLATFCSTWLDEEIHKLMDESIDKNMIDRDEYPQTAAIEERCVHMLADLWNAPDATTTIGCSTIGSSEAAMLCGMALKWKWREKMKLQGKSCDKPNMICGPVQICWHKFARYWDIELREVPMEKDRIILNAQEVISRCDENTIAVVPTLGVTFTGQYEPVKEISDALDKLQKDTGLDIPIHVDGASGGFLAPFTEPELEWDFRLPRVKSINASGHKFGLSPLGVGWAVWRSREDLPEDLIFSVNYLGGKMEVFALNFSRPGGQVISQYYNFLRLGKEGYKKIHDACYDTAAYIGDQIDKLGPFEIIYNGKGGIPAVVWQMKKGFDKQFNLFDLSDRLRTRGWQAAAYSLPSNLKDVVVMRVLVRHGISRDLGDLFVADVKRSLEHFKKHEAKTQLTEDEGGGFRH